MDKTYHIVYLICFIVVILLQGGILTVMYKVCEGQLALVETLNAFVEKVCEMEETIEDSILASLADQQVKIKECCEQQEKRQENRKESSHDENGN